MENIRSAFGFSPIVRTGHAGGTSYRWTIVADGKASVEFLGKGGRFYPYGPVFFNPFTDPVGHKAIEESMIKSVSQTAEYVADYSRPGTHYYGD